MREIYTFIIINSNKARYLLLYATLTTHIYFTKYTVSYANSTAQNSEWILHTNYTTLTEKENVVRKILILKHNHEINLVKIKP